MVSSVFTNLPPLLRKKRQPTIKSYLNNLSNVWLGGAGGVEAVFTALALRDQFAPPTIHYAQPDPECDLDYVPNVGRAQNMTYALSNSLGFGGHNACIALRRWEE